MGVLVPRSSTCLKHGIMMANSVGIIENDYSGDGDVWGVRCLCDQGHRDRAGNANRAVHAC
jgi:dUTPase